MCSHEKEDGVAHAPFSDSEAGVACCGCFGDDSEHWTDFEIDNGKIVGYEFKHGWYLVAEVVSTLLIGAVDVFYRSLILHVLWNIVSSNSISIFS